MMNGNSTGITTLSVRQLARLIGRSEQTVRRWNDQGKLRAELSGNTDGGVGLVFSVDAVREFVRKNPRLLDKAKPELIELLNGNQAYSVQMAVDSEVRSAERSAAKTGAVVAAASLITAGLGSAMFPVVAGGAALALAGKFLGNKREDTAPNEDNSYLLQLLMAREKEAVKQLTQLEEELLQIGKEQNKGTTHSEYMRQLLQARAVEIERSMDGLRLELEQIKEEVSALGGECSACGQQ